LPTNDSVLFSVRFRAVHPKDAGDCRLLQFFEVPMDDVSPTAATITSCTSTAQYCIGTPPDFPRTVMQQLLEQHMTFIMELYITFYSTPLVTTACGLS
jgi:hypothetical protein